MARIQGLIQQHALERSISPVSTSYIGGMSGASEGVPKMHPLKSSNPVFKASNLIHLAKMRPPSMRIPKLRMPRV